MFFPLHDENSLKSIRFQFVTLSLIAINVAIHVLGIVPRDDMTAMANVGIVPRELFDSTLAVQSDAIRLAIPEGLTLITYMFFHGDFVHLAGNMLFLWVFGDNVEDAMGHLKFLFFYLACGVAGGLTHAWVEPGSGAPLVGASAAVAGVIAAYLMLHPRVRVWVLALKAIPLRISAAFALGLWILFQILMVLFPPGGSVAWWAHIGGLVAGAVLIVFLRRPGVPLFDKGLTTA